MQVNPVVANEAAQFDGVFESLPPTLKDEVEQLFVTERCGPGTVVIREGDAGDRFFLVVSGQLEVWKAQRGLPAATPVPARGEVWQVPEKGYALVDRLGPGTGFGEIALISSAPRSASVRAATEVELRSLEAEAFARLLAADASLALGFEMETAIRRATHALARSTPFAGQPPELLRWLALRMTPVTFEAGEDVIREGAAADGFYVIRSGRVEVLGTRDDGREYRIDESGEGEAFGEQALIARRTRAATIRATERVELLRLSPEDFDDVLARYPDRALYLLVLSRQRQRPRRYSHVVASPQPGAPGTYILNDTHSHRYLKLSEAGLFLWDLMDGERSVRDLSIEYFRRYRRFGVDLVIQLILDLHIAGFVDVPDIHPKLALEIAHLGRMQRFMLQLRSFAVRHFSIPDPDVAVSWAYRVVFWPLFRMPAQVGLLLVALIGLGFFVYQVATGRARWVGLDDAELVVFVVLGLALHVILHETAHALTTKHFGRDVHAAGIGWYFLSVIAFVDTSDMWLEGKRRRMTVALAGSYSNFVLAGIAALGSGLAGPSPLATVLFTLAVDGYIIGLMNLNPLYELDGYYALSDWLDVSNLRSKALAYLGTVLWRTQPTTSDRRLQRIFTMYAAAAVLYAFFAALMLLLSYHRLLQDRVAEVLPPEAAFAIGVLAALLLLFLLLDNLLRALRHRVGQVSAIGR